VAGGSFTNAYLGVNWWAAKRWKLDLGWTRTWLDKEGVEGVTDTVLARFQWVY